MKRLISSLGLIIVTILMVGCASQTETAQETEGHEMEGMDNGSAAEERPIDAMFIDGMIPHHQSAIDMAEMALEQAEHEEIRTLAQQIIDAQQSEIDMMMEWRAEWYPDLPPTDGMHMEGMMSEEDMMMSTDESIPFDLRFLDAMIPHHQGAIQMAQAVLDSAEHEEVRTMAQGIIDSQQAEIDQMQAWRTEWYPDAP